jgi:hypothetical protein
MRKLFVLFLLFTLPLFAQAEEIIINTTVANDASSTGYITIPSNADMTVDSIDLQGIFTGEIDIDKLIVTKGILKSSKGGLTANFLAVATPDTTTLTIDNAAAATTGAVYTAASTGLNSLGGYNVIKIVFIAGSSGNDATDPNMLKCIVRKTVTFKR